MLLIEINPILFPMLERKSIRMDLYFQGKTPSFTPPLSFNGSPFRLIVWNILLKIPYVATMTYGEIAAIIAKKQGVQSMSAQAVGRAVAHNPISVIVPCHRVVGTNGSLTGYAGGLRRKLRCWNWKRLICENFIFPQKGSHYREQRMQIAVAWKRIVLWPNKKEGYFR